MSPGLTKRQREELKAVKAIFVSELSGGSCGKPHLIARFPIRITWDPVVISITLPLGYPNNCRPVYEITGWPHEVRTHIDDINRIISTSLDELFVPGQEILFEWLESVKETLSQWDVSVCSTPQQSNGQAYTSEKGVSEEILQRETEADSLTSCGSDTENYEHGYSAFGSGRKWEEKKLSNNGVEEIEIRSSTVPLIMRKSAFVAHVAKVTSKSQVDHVMECILKNKRVARATHNIMAYRIYNGKTNMVIEDFDDDGEAAAGGRLMQMLRTMKVVDVVVVVSRWYGGVNLGPARFKCINTVASNLLKMCTDLGFLK